MTIAAAIGCILQFVYQTGPYTLLLGLLGAFSGFFYSTPPIRLVKRGIGEIFIGFCYGWLPVASAYYIQTGTIHPDHPLDWRYPSALPFLMSFYSMSFPIMPPTKPRARKTCSTVWAKKTEMFFI
ncbi:MAG: prenyltransferase [Desulfosudis oleivorans]|nr:prenyltransferase [Desulfosudis oleivorans]